MDISSPDALVSRMLGGIGAARKDSLFVFSLLKDCSSKQVAPAPVSTNPETTSPRRSTSRCGRLSESRRCRDRIDEWARLSELGG